MNNDINNFSPDDSDPPDTTTTTTADDHAPPSSALALALAVSSSSPSPATASSSSFTTTNPTTSLTLSRTGTGTRNPRKKRTTKLITILDDDGSSIGRTNPKPYYKKPDPDAPKITRPCTECGKKFWSWKALFGHMRCHPERQWRGINPPPNHVLMRHQPQPQSQQPRSSSRGLAMTDKDDYEVAECLLLLANGKEKKVKTENDDVTCQSHDEQERFECSSCKKVFGSHQALGGHRASHKNVKGCFAITRTTHNHVAAADDDHDHVHDDVMTMIHSGASAGAGTTPLMVDDASSEHKCSICLRVFSTGQALGGHKRCHWEKSDMEPTSMAAPPPPPVDLNLPPPPLPAPPAAEDHGSAFTLDLRLGL